MTKYLLLCGIFILSAAAVASPTAEQLITKIEKQGAGKTISDLYANNEKEWEYVTAQITQGDNDWLKVASLLAPGADADSAETLSTAVALAIPHNPVGVLDIMTEQYNPLSLYQVCGLPFYSITEAQLNQYIVDAIRALYKVSSGKACLDTIVNTVGQSENFREDI